MALTAKIKVVAIVDGKRREFAPGENLEGILSAHDIASLKQLRALEDSDLVEAKARQDATVERTANAEFQVARERVQQSQASLSPGGTSKAAELSAADSIDVLIKHQQAKSDSVDTQAGADATHAGQDGVPASSSEQSVTAAVSSSAKPSTEDELPASAPTIPDQATAVNTEAAPKSPKRGRPVRQA